ncbi:hypothetical protein TNCV_1562381 [Trichonephila clavipes]|nr:hypothetical protein TNCV_1562381 [Trichonephila clavipes]
MQIKECTFKLDSVAIEVSSRPKLTGIVRGKAFLHVLRRRSIAAPQQLTPMWPYIVIHKNEVWANGTSEQTHMGKKYLLTLAIPDYRSSVETVELSSA